MSNMDESDGREWHAGELAMQKYAGVEDVMAGVARQVVRNYMLDQHREFFGQLPFLLAGSVSDEGGVWATMIAGERGFIETPDAVSMVVECKLNPSDPAAVGIREGQSIGFLGIDLLTRRRNRMNGVVRSSENGRLIVSVVQSFGNCPAYIQRRAVLRVHESAAANERVVFTAHELDGSMREMVTTADTFFVASYADVNGARFVDVSHRGGRRGFVKVEGSDQLIIPDFAGNAFFNTMGNILLTRKAGLLFVNFSNGDILQLSGDAEVLLNESGVEEFAGAELFWRFKVREGVRREGALPLRWIDTSDGVSPSTEMTGAWKESRARD
ncbi:pyridoxamine 5'-phosphate oxidase family protein [Paraburkholderia flagellata]|uniref:pyridoxamine 5'-phosphate oxidase family protein n=1 Tax=Paraburkholderia flagellata TaxID=2883241 RepID=UPI001F3664D4|nr:pyridoxamine 5'-phosphate oxidase family protein [Paraburkholderia flagellata]